MQQIRGTSLYNSILKEELPSKTSWWPPRTKILCLRKVGSSTDINVTGWSVMKNIQESLPEHLQRGSRNIKRPHPHIYHHYNITGHKISIDNFSIMGREDQNLRRTIKEALYIRVNNPSLNRNTEQIPSVIHLGWGSVKHLRT